MVAEAQRCNRPQHFRQEKLNAESNESQTWHCILEHDYISKEIKNWLPDSWIFTDASDFGATAVIYIGNDRWKTFENIAELSGELSTLRELHAASFALKAFAPLLIKKKVQLYTDSSSAVAIIDNGSISPGLHKYCIEIHQTMREARADILPR